jgi:DNA-binding NarL/FixJ family response regulator
VNLVETIQSVIVVLQLRLNKVEGQVKLIEDGNAVVAQTIHSSEDFGLDPKIVVEALSRAARQTLARQLREKGWTAKRIAREMGVTERTVWRWINERPE